jgi:nucleoside-diphosphate-sugar epimerase
LTGRPEVQQARRVTVDLVQAPSLWLFGATSAVGCHLLPLLQAPQFAVTAFTRRSPTPWRVQFPQIHWLQSSLADAPSIGAGVTHVLSLGPCDAFVDWLARQSTSSSLRQVIAFGSTSAETKIDSASADERALAASLRESEARLASECARIGIAWTLLRPTLIYGGANDLVARIGRMAARWHVYPRPLGAIGRALRQPVHAADLASAVMAGIDNPAAFNGRFDLAGQETLSLAALIRRCAQASGRRALPLPLPGGLLLRLAGSFGAFAGSSRLSGAAATRLARDQVFDTAPARAALGFAPRGFAP